MTSRLHVTKTNGSRGEVTFIAPIKAVFGRVLCDTDGSVGYPTVFDAETALRIVAECESLCTWPGDKQDLEKVKRWAQRGHELFADWSH